MKELKHLKEKYSDNVLRCQDCGHEIKLLEVIEKIEEQELDTIFTPQTIEDLAFANCTECGTLRLHEIDTIKSEAEGDSETSDEKSEQDAPGQSESNSDSNKPFSI